MVAFVFDVVRNRTYVRAVKMNFPTFIKQHDAFSWSQKKYNKLTIMKTLLVSLANTHISCYNHFASSIVVPRYIPNNNKVDQLKLSHKLYGTTQTIPESC